MQADPFNSIKIYSMVKESIKEKMLVDKPLIDDEAFEIIKVFAPIELQLQVQAHVQESSRLPTDLCNLILRYSM